jgi:CHAT domain-containing protein
MARTDAQRRQDELIDRLAQARDTRARAGLLRRHHDLVNPAAVDRMYTRVVQLARIDLTRANRLAQAVKWIAEALDDDRCRAQGLRAGGHVWIARGRYREALEHYDSALLLFRRLGREVDVARTLNGALQCLISLGRYDEALTAAQEARAIFERHGNRLGLARLDSNVGNILYRQDRFDEALALYRRAYEQLAEIGEPQDVAAALGNIAITYTSLNDFQKAQASYEQARAVCERHGLLLFAARADYNVAYLYYLRGEYTRALELYRTVREHSERLGDTYRSALCDLDRSEMYLELNLSEEAGELAARALARFDRLGMAYEAAKAVTNLALATSRQGDIPRALDLFDQAQALFKREGNRVWLGLVNYYQALVLYRQGQYARARALCEAALKLFARAAVPGQAALCELLLARLELQAGDLDAAERACGDALAKLAGTGAPILSYQAHFVHGLVREARGEREAAYGAFRNAHDGLEQLRSHLRADDLKVAFLEDKMAVYESLVTTCLSRSSDSRRQKEAFAYIENAKSRSLADLIAFRAAMLAPRVAGAATEDVQRLRQQLTWHYRQLDMEDMSRQDGSDRRIERLRHRARALEKQLAGSLEAAGRTDQEFSALQSGKASGLDEIRATLPPDTILLEYYQARGRYCVCVLTRDGLEVVPLSASAPVRRLLRLLQFQLSKFRLDPSYVGAFAAELQAAAKTHLHELHSLLIAPVRDRLEASHLVVVPHDVLHGVPFHALFDGRRFLVDDYTVSYAPSSSVYRLCRTKPESQAGDALVMGVPDARTPFINDEIEAVAGVLPNPRVFLGSEATLDQLRTHSAGSRFVHIATHGMFRRDNPMFSSIQLGDGPLGVYDLYQLRLSAELVTLSGCSTGRSAVAGGDELLGLVRGLLYAGARAVMLTLWDTDDRSAADFMKAFYGHLQRGAGKGRAAQDAMLEIRTRYPHPFHWAPFTLIGDVHTSRTEM